MSGPPTLPPAPPPGDKPPRPPMRFYYSLPTWFFTASPEERATPEFELRLRAFIRQQIQERDRKAKLDDESHKG